MWHTSGTVLRMVAHLVASSASSKIMLLIAPVLLRHCCTVHAMHTAGT